MGVFSYSKSGRRAAVKGKGIITEIYRKKGQILCTFEYKNMMVTANEKIRLFLIILRTYCATLYFFVGFFFVENFRVSPFYVSFKFLQFCGSIFFPTFGIYKEIKKKITKFRARVLLIGKLTRESLFALSMFLLFLYRIDSFIM